MSVDPLSPEPGAVPDAAAAASFLAAQRVVIEYFARVDSGEIVLAASLYTEEAVFLGAQGPAAIESAMRGGLAANASRRSRHVIANVRCTAAGDGAVLVQYTALAYTLDPDAPPAIRSIFDQEMVLRPEEGGLMRIAEHRISGFQP